MIFDYVALKTYISALGIKQKVVAEKANIDERKLCLIIQGKRKCEAGEYANLCNALGVEPNKFMKPRMPEKGEKENESKSISAI